MPVRVVEVLEVIDVDHQKADGVTQPFGLLDLLCEGGTKVAEVKDAGRRVGKRKAPGFLVEPGVLNGDRCTVREKLEHVEIVLAKGLAAPGDERTERAPARFESNGNDVHRLRI